MLKKLSFSALAMASAVSFAGTMGPVVQDSGYSFFIGGAAGIGMLQGDYTGYNPVNTDTHYASLGDNSFIGGGLLGIQTVLANNVYLALVGNVLYNSQDSVQRSSTGPSTNPVRNHDVTVSNDFQYGGNIRLGMKMGNATPYILGGVEAGKWELGLGNISSTWNRGIAPLSGINYSKTLTGGQAGAGILVALNNNWNMGMEYAHTWFGDVNVDLIDGVTAFRWNHKADIQQDQVLFSLNYIFNA
ncbi:outer membrane protein [Legionella worsleiensis]|uniref:Outer membrane protein beta-barrel domain-containing protein n=1 Tax=Legionella worsleiensis TaxID=45076 RepID=A0A0W1AIK6_9GAMM|nr:outer membrane beta-barrel protein [Legionella worsleiensis]KTD81163.1 hypothetical protein Lwor_0841 [Legionella worsleiensis]STY33138.1 Opacity protein and related surface antigens [Legionella worsleiensis]